MPFACRTWGKAVGAWGPVDTSPGTQGSIDSSENLGKDIYQLQNQTKTGFGEDHSGQFTARIQELKPFYNILLDKLQVKRNNP